MTTAWYDDNETPEQIGEQMARLQQRAGRLPEAEQQRVQQQYADRITFGFDDDDETPADEPTKEEPSRWDRAQAARNAATSEQSSHRPQGPAPSGGSAAAQRVAEEREKLRQNPGSPWDAYLQAKHDEAMGA